MRKVELGSNAKRELKHNASFLDNPPLAEVRNMLMRNFVDAGISRENALPLIEEMVKAEARSRRNSKELYEELGAE